MMFNGALRSNLGLSKSMSREETVCVTLIRHALRARHLPPGEGKDEEEGSFFHISKCYSRLWNQQYVDFPHTLAFPWGKVAPALAGDG